VVKTIGEGFQIYIQRLVPRPTEGRAARQHQSSVGACLRAGFDGARLVPTGSLGRRTALRRHSDADYFIVIPRGLITNDSSEMLRRVRSTLRGTFPKSTISVSKPAVVVPFGRGGCESLDIVPAVFAARTEDGHYIFDIPDGAGGWIRSSPGAHKALVHSLDERLSCRLRPLILLVKAWNVEWNKPIRNFYLEMRVVRYASTVKSIDYGRGIERVFESIIGSHGLAALRDPTGIGGLIRPCLTEGQERQAVQKVQRALARAVDARKADASGNIAKAYERWDLFFNHAFTTRT
jgi:Second Messenger Oligonucleotide or Dinucleotide Synthetase domain